MRIFLNSKTKDTNKPSYSANSPLSQNLTTNVRYANLTVFVVLILPLLVVPILLLIPSLRIVGINMIEMAKSVSLFLIIFYVAIAVNALHYLRKVTYKLAGQGRKIDVKVSGAVR